ncbi:MAG: LexA family protein [Anaerostipes sp.]|jgi:SOS-response transcriptional repressor LexA|nr:helix-turn-helix domain-containing protein [Lachnospira sp.]
MAYKRFDLTEKQGRIYDYICDYLKEHGFPPTVREIAKMAGLSSASSAHGYLKQLEEKGYIRRMDNSPRAIEIV